MVAELEKLRQAQRGRCCLEIGELLRVRGPVKTSRQQREIMASTYCEWRWRGGGGAFLCRKLAALFLNVIYPSIATTNRSTFFRMCVPSAAHSSCAFPDKVDDPVMAVQIARMMEVPELYRRCYDKRLELRPLAMGRYEHPSSAAPRRKFERVV